MNSRFLLYTGAIVPVVFFGTTLLCGFMQGNYNHLARMVSELGTIGTRSQFTFMAGLLTCSFLSCLFVVALLKTCNRADMNVFPVVMILSFSVSIAGAALFPLPLRLHGILGMPSILLVLSPLLAVFLWRKEKRLSHVLAMSIVSFCVMSLGFLAFAPDVLPRYPGLKQRFFHLGWSIWFIYLSTSFVRLLDPMNRAGDGTISA